MERQKDHGKGASTGRMESTDLTVNVRTLAVSPQGHGRSVSHVGLATDMQKLDHDRGYGRQGSPRSNRSGYPSQESSRPHRSYESFRLNSFGTQDALKGRANQGPQRGPDALNYHLNSGLGDFGLQRSTHRTRIEKGQMKILK